MMFFVFLEDGHFVGIVVFLGDGHFVGILTS